MEGLSVLLAVIFLVGYTLGEGDCPVRFPLHSEENTTCYAIIPERKTFKQARDYCRSLPTTSGFSTPDLAVIDTESVQNRLKSALRDSVLERLWIGLTEEFTDWMWAPINKPIRPQGCFDLSSLSEDSLREDISASLGLVTNSQCQQTCQSLRYTYAGVFMVEDYYSIPIKTTARCRCGNVFKLKKSQALETPCDTPCPGATSEKCGNVQKIIIYRVTNTSATDLWLSSEPNNYDGYARCLTLTTWPERKWDDKNCGYTQGTSHICQYWLDKSACTAYYHDDSGTCFKPVRGSSLSWFQARAQCLKAGGDLLVVDSPALLAFLKQTDEVKDEQVSSYWWIGGGSSKWTWINGEQLGAFVNWDVNNPAKPDGHCTVIHVNSGGDKTDESKRYKWEDNDCENLYSFICETAGPVAQTTQKTTPKAPTPTPATTPTPTAAGTVVTASSTPGHRENGTMMSSRSDGSIVFTNGVIVAIVIASVALMVATIRLIVYCCQRRRLPADDRRGLSP